MEGILAAAWTAGIVEGASVLSSTSQPGDKQVNPQLLVPAVLYGTLSLPLGLFGASPGPSIIEKLPFGPGNVDVTPQQSAPVETPKLDEPPPPPPTVRGKRRVDLLREENRSRHARSAPTVAAAVTVQPPPPVPRQPLQYLATLDGQPLATPLAEAMRRTRFLLIGAGLVTAVVAYQTKQHESREKQKREQGELSKTGKNPKALQEYLSKSTQGAAVRWSSNGSRAPCCSRNNSQFAEEPHFATVALHSQPTTANLPYWNVGSKPEEWSETPITMDWLMRTKNDSRMLVLEADVTPSSLEQHFSVNAIALEELSKALVLFQSLSATAERLLPSSSDTVRVVLGTGKPTLPLDDNVIYVDALKGLSAQVNAALEELHDLVEFDFHASKKEALRRKEEEAASTPQPSEPTASLSMRLGGDKPTKEKIQILIQEGIERVDSIGSSIRQAATWTADFAKQIHDDHILSHRVIHVLSDERSFVQFLQSSLQDWRIVWYNATNENDVQLYLETETAISVVCCCSGDFTTKALLAATTAESSGRVLAVMEDDDKALVPSGVTTISVQAVHDNMFSNIRELLSEGKTVAEVQEVID